MAATSPGATVTIDHAQAITFALEQAGVPIIHGVRIHNAGSEPLPASTLTIELLPDLGPPVEIPVPPVQSGEVAVRGVVDIRLPPNRLRTVVEAERGQLAWRLTAEGRLLAEGSKPVEILAYNEWPGRRAPPELLAMYVTPNHPVVTTILRRVRDRLRVQTGNNAIDGYQSRSTKRVRETVRALYESLQTFGISYQQCLASFEATGQKIRFADRVLSDQLANCLDMTLLAASCLEQMGLFPLLVLVEGHAFPGVWLKEERFPEGVVGDAARLRTAMAIGELVFFDSSTTILHPPRALEEAIDVANDWLANDDSFVLALDVNVARMGAYRPLPIRDVALPTELSLQASNPSQVVSQEARTLLQEAAALPPSPPEPPLPSPTKAPEPLDPLNGRLKRWRERLLDLSLRNRLLNFRDTKASLALHVPNAAAFEDALADEGSFELLPLPSRVNDPRHPQLLAARTDEDELAARIVKDFERGIVHSPLAPADFAYRVIHLDRTARSDLEEGGANTLFAAIGFLRWYESESSEAERFAPLLLVPVGLERQRLSGRVRLRGLPDDALPNVTLVEKLRRDFDLDLTALANLEADDHGRDVTAMFHAVRQAIRHMPRWEVTEEVHLGLFTFAKFLMWRDLEENAALLLESPVVRHIAEGALSPFPNPSPPAEPRLLDATVPPAQLPLVVDADSTQTAAVVSGLQGRSFVLQGPPGTGKSQTITNLIAASLAEGKTVLFISEKMAALDVVKRRLEQTGLGDFCLELHSHKAQKKEVIESLGRSLERATTSSPSPWDERSRELRERRAELNAYARALHDPRPLGKSFYEASARLLALESAPKVAVSFPNVMAATDAQLRALLEAASSYAVSAKAIEPVAAHPYRDARLVAWSAQTEASLRSEIEGALSAISAVNFAGQQLASRVGLPYSQSLAALEELAQVSLAASTGPVPPWLLDEAQGPQLSQRAIAYVNESHVLTNSRAELATRWQDGIYELDLDALEARFARYARAFFLIAFFMLFGARSQLRKLRSAPLSDDQQTLRDLGLARSIRGRSHWLQEEHRALAQAFYGCWSMDPREDPMPLLQRAEQLRSALRRYRAISSASLSQLVSLTEPSVLPARRQDVAQQASALSHTIASLRRHVNAALAILSPFPGVVPAETNPAYLNELSALLSRYQQGLASFRSFCFYRAHEASFAGWGALPIIASHQAGSIRNEDIAPATERAFLQNWTDTLRDAEPALRSFDGPNQHRLVERFRKADREHIELGRRRVAELLEAKLPRITGPLSEASETGKLQRELRKKARHLPVRRLLAELPNLATRLKPCFLMSPMSVAQYLPAGARRFDLVVFDEASQIGTHDAIGAIARGKQVVIVGDSKQLPPTTFFQRGISEDDAADENDIEELESILDEAIASGIPEQMLGWHYRSRHEALIDFSNQHYYDGRLNVFPAARGRVAELGISFHPVPHGVYDKSKTRTNRARGRGPRRLSHGRSLQNRAGRAQLRGRQLQPGAADALAGSPRRGAREEREGRRPLREPPRRARLRQEPRKRTRRRARRDPLQRRLWQRRERAHLHALRPAQSARRRAQAQRRHHPREGEAPRLLHPDPRADRPLPHLREGRSPPQGLLALHGRAQPCEQQARRRYGLRLR